MRILIAEDAPFIREIVRHLIERTGDTLVGEAVDGEEAVALALRERPDVILMDIVMPKKSGIDATREILRALPQTRIIAFSTADQETMIVQALDAGCCSFVTKPFKSEDLLKAIHQAQTTDPNTEAQRG